MKNYIFTIVLKVLVVVVIFFSALAVWYFPVMFKGYSPDIVGSAMLVRAKNLANLDLYSSENQNNVILSSNRIIDEGQESKAGKKTTGFFYSKIISIFNPDTNEKIFFINCIILAVALLFFALSFYFLFGGKIALIFSIIYIFLPLNLSLPAATGYPFSVLLLSLFIFFIVLGYFSRKTESAVNEQGEKNIFKIIALVFSGVFLALTCLSNEVFFLILPVLFVYFLLKKNIKYILLVFVPIILMLGLFWLPDFVKGNNAYLAHFSGEINHEFESSDYDRFGHIFTDPYTFHYLKDEHINNRISKFADSSFISQLSNKKILYNFGYYDLNFFERLLIGANLTFSHLIRFLSLNEFGGPLVFLIFLLGIFSLLKRNNQLLKFYLLWILGGIFLLSFVILSYRNHMMEYGHFIALCLALGVLVLSNIIFSKYTFIRSRAIVNLFLLFLLIYHLVLVGHMKWGDAYNEDTYKKVEHIQVLKSFNGKNSIVAVPFSSTFTYNLNYSTNQSLVIFKENTVKKLISENKLSQAFDDFNVEYVYGYSESVLKNITASDENIKVVENDYNLEKRKSDYNNWIMNIIR